ncbi:MAG: hypothetical protein Q4B03_01420 [Lachnospiraceae bacterium]|nr:hypothetical protein [Lachnospiraceae bacterium]
MAEKTMESLLQNEAFAEKLVHAASIDEMKAMIEAEGVQIPDEELAVFRRVLEEKAAAGQSAGAKQELSDDMLENVTGGVFLTGSTNFLDFDVVQILWKKVSEHFRKPEKKDLEDFLRECVTGKDNFI